MEWLDDGILLTSTRYGERSLRVELFCQKQGRHAGFIRFAGKTRPQAGNLFITKWRSRLSEQLGQIQLHPKQEIFAHIANDMQSLLLLQSALSLLCTGLAERDPTPLLYHSTLLLLNQLHQKEDISTKIIGYIQWELAFLRHTGFGLDLNRCALTGTNKDLRFVSPNTGRAITQEQAKGKAWRNKLLSLPVFLNPLYAIHYGDDNPLKNKIHFHDLQEGLKLTGFFLEKQFLTLGNRSSGLPEIRQNLTQNLT